MNIKEFREKWVKRKQYDSWQDVLDTVRGNDVMLTNIINEVSTSYARTIAKKSLENASDNAVMLYHDGHSKESNPTKHVQIGANNVQIDKNSILTDKNCPI